MLTKFPQTCCSANHHHIDAQYAIGQFAVTGTNLGTITRQNCWIVSEPSQPDDMSDRCRLPLTSI